MIPVPPLSRAYASVSLPDGHVASVEHVGRTHEPRNVWRWRIYVPDRPVMAGDDLTTAMDVSDPDPLAALSTLGAFLGDYADTREHDADALFYGLPRNVARALAQAVMLEFPEDPTCDYCGRRQDDTPDMIWDGDTGCHVECERGCEECGADKGEPCFPFCTARDSVEPDPLVEAEVTFHRVIVESCDHGPLRVATCGGCHRSWCDACDPAHGPLCPWCHGRGYSTAPRESS